MPAATAAGKHDRRNIETALRPTPATKLPAVSAYRDELIGYRLPDEALVIQLRAMILSLSVTAEQVRCPGAR